MMSCERQTARLGAGAIATVMVALALEALAVPSVHAQQQTTLPPVVVSPSTPRSGSDDRKGAGENGGANGKDGGGPSFKDLNQQLKRKVDEVNPTANNPPLDASSPDPKTGVINIPGVQQQYGKNFGHSAEPFRPPPPVYTSPLGSHR